MLGIVALLALVTVAYAGGWVIVTVRDVPEYAVAGRPLQLTLMVRDVGGSPADGLTPNIAAKSEAEMVRAPAVMTKNAGEYTATLVLPRRGNWTIQFNAFDDSSRWERSMLPELTVIAPGSSAPAPMSQATLGERLFSAKGCNGCHVHPEVKEGRVYGPDLTGRRFAPEYLKRFLADPSMTPVPETVCSRDGSYCGSPYAMPNLNLKDAEIDALVAFIVKK